MAFKQIIDNEYVGFGSMYFDVPLNIGEKEINKLKQEGYQQICLPHITTDGNSRSLMKIQLGINLSACCRILAKELTKNLKSLPICLYAKDGLNGGLTLRPFRLVMGTTFETNAKDESNKKISVDLIIEEPIKVL